MENTNNLSSVVVLIFMSTEHIQVWHHTGLVDNPRL